MPKIDFPYSGPRRRLNSKSKIERLLGIVNSSTVIKSHTYSGVIEGAEIKIKFCKESSTMLYAKTQEEFERAREYIISHVN